MEDQELVVCSEDCNLVTDLYQLTMTACYVAEELDQKWASFELFTRSLPKNFGYLIAMGLAQALEYLDKFHFSTAQIESLQSTGIFNNVPKRFWSLLSGARFSGNVWAVPEGTAIFANEPLLRIEAPLWQAFFFGTYLLNTLNYQTLIATKAARIRDAAGPEVKLLEGGTRRAFGPQASVWAARAALAAGFDSTSNVLAALKLGRQPSGSIAHAFIMASAAMEGSEAQAFMISNSLFPDASLVLDTYDTVTAANNLADMVRTRKVELQGVRLDSGNLTALSQQVRSLLPPEVLIFASGDLDEWAITKLRNNGACIDGYSVGTQLVTGYAMNGVYKIVEVEGIPIMKHSSGKVNYPGRKQIFRRFEHQKIQGDRLGLITEAPQQDEQALMQLMFKQGQRLHLPETLEKIFERTAQSVASLTTEVRQIDQPIPIQPQISIELQNLTKQAHEAVPLQQFALLQ
ncbi:nicotinate phosphoribosyltransferase [Hapalosiphon sp. MRB220]|nr:nicotinate phosphoribosyltransferase [Hapalosiphon sp. MRB220]